MLLEYCLYTLLLLISLAGVAINILSLPGNWIMFIAAIGWFWWRDWHMRLSTPAWLILVLMLGALLAAEALEFLGSIIGARKFGASKLAAGFSIVGAFIGALLGFMIPVPLIGNLIGAVLGAFLIAWLVELILERPVGPAAKAALGAALGRGMGFVTKIGFGLAVWLALAVFAFP